VPAMLALTSAGISLFVMGPPAGALALAMFGGFILYLRTFRLHMPRPEGFLPLYLGALAWQFLHFLEEFATGFQREFPALIGTNEWTDIRFVAFNMVHYSLFLVSAVALVKGVRPLTYFASFFIIAMLVNGIGHPLLGLWVGGYFPGLLTGWGSLVWAVLTLRQLRRPAATRVVT